MVLPEIVAVGIYNSQFAAKNIAVSKKRKTSMFEIELPLENGGISYIEDSAMPITSNMIICAKPGQFRHTKFPFKCYFIHMILHSDTLYDTLVQTPNIFETEKAENYRRIFQKLIKYNTAADNEIIMQSLVLEMIYTISRDVAGLTKQGSHGSGSTVRMEKALQYIKENLTEELTLEKVAQSVSVSPIHFHNSFKTAVGKTLREYVEEQRIRKAIHLLMSTEYSLTEIAYACGFSSQSYFSYVFKRRMQKTPREYVRELYDKYEL